MLTPIVTSTKYHLTLEDIKVRIANELGVSVESVNVYPRYKSSDYDGPGIPSRDVIGFDIIVEK